MAFGISMQAEQLVVRPGVSASPLFAFKAKRPIEEVEEVEEGDVKRTDVELDDDSPM
jgi:hypothetical protein